MVPLATSYYYTSLRISVWMRFDFCKVKVLNATNIIKSCGDPINVIAFRFVFYIDLFVQQSIIVAVK